MNYIDKMRTTSSNWQINKEWYVCKTKNNPSENTFGFELSNSAGLKGKE